MARDSTSSPPSAYLFALAAVLAWSTVATAFELSLRVLDPLQLLAWSSVAAVLVLAVVLVVTGRLRLLRSLTRRDLLHGAILGLVNPFGYYLVLFEAYDRLPAQLAQPLNYTWPMVLVLLSIPLLRQRVRAKSVVALVVCFVGVVIISTEGGREGMSVADPVGVALAMGSSLLWAVYWLLTVRRELDPVVKLFLAFTMGSVPVFVVASIWSSPLQVTGMGLVGAAYVGVFEMGLTFVAWLGALERAKSAAHVGVLVYLSPFLSLVFIGMILDEPILPSTIVGLVVIVAGILIQQAPRGRGRRRSS